MKTGRSPWLIWEALPLGVAVVVAFCFASKRMINLFTDDEVKFKRNSAKANDDKKH